MRSHLRRLITAISIVTIVAIASLGHADDEVAVPPTRVGPKAIQDDGTAAVPVMRIELTSKGSTYFVWGKRAGKKLDDAVARIKKGSASAVRIDARCKMQTQVVCNIVDSLRRNGIEVQQFQVPRSWGSERLDLDLKLLVGECATDLRS